MSNPFCAPGCTLEAPGPLNPWRVKTHVSYYVDVDNTETSYKEFLSSTEQWDINNVGASVIVCGENGCGKTSLVNRCVCHLVDTVTTKTVVLKIVDRSNENLAGLTFLRKCEDTVRAVLREIRLSNNFLSQTWMDQLPDISRSADEDELRRVIDDISAFIHRENRVILVVPPKIELFAEFKLYLSIFSRSNLILMMETNDEGVRQAVERMNKTAGQRKVLTLGVGPIEVEHGWAFVKSRMASQKGSTLDPTFEEESVNKYLENRCKHAKVSIREFELVCLRLFEEAVRKPTKIINYEAFCDLWVKFGGEII